MNQPVRSSYARGKNLPIREMQTEFLEEFINACGKLRHVRQGSSAGLQLVLVPAMLSKQRRKRRIWNGIRLCR